MSRGLKYASMIAACTPLFFAACDDDVSPGQPDATVTPDTADSADTSDSADTAEPDGEEPEALRITALEPSEGRTSGLEEVAITGNGLADVVEVLFGDTAGLDPFPVNDHLLVVLTPPRARGLVDVTIVTADGERATAPLAYEFADPVQLTAVDPVEGHWLGGERITVYGAGFTEDAVVLVGGRAALEVVHVDDQTLTAVTPEGAPGPADVHVSTREGVARLRAAYTYTGDLLPAGVTTLERIEPDHGPIAGGTVVTLSGSGFRAGAAVRIGALQATAVEVESSTRIRAKTPVGSAGAASVRVLQDGGVSALADAFTYDGVPAVWAVDPPLGAIAGNTRVVVRGHGFPTSGAVTVTFAGREASAVEVVDARTIVCLTPRGEVGLAAVDVSRGGVVVAAHPSAFTYFDPSTTPGTWGGPIEGNLNITVQDAQSGARLEGATVVLGPNVQTSLRGFTDDAGQITFSGDAVLGRQTVTASIAGYQVFQLAAFDASNVTLPLERVPKCSDLDDFPCEQVTEPPPLAFLVATIVGSEKGPTTPFGECRDWQDAPHGMCQACAVDEDCTGIKTVGDGELGEEPGAVIPSICRDLGSEGAFCTFACESDADCNGGFVCLDPTGQELDKRCVPPPGTPATYCDQTETDVWSDDSIAYPGIRVPSNKVVQVGIHLGDFAVFCWSGVDVRGDFRPQFLGVTRNLGAYADGEVVETEVAIDIPLSQRVAIEVDRPTHGFFGEEMTVVRTALNLGGDGVLAFPTRRGFLTDRFVLNVPEALNGELYDATWEMVAEVDVAPLNGGSTLYERGLERLDRDLDYRFANGAWAPFEAPALTTRGLATWQDGGGAEAVVAVGERGAILKRYGETWAYMSGATDRDLLAIAVADSGDAPSDDAIAVGMSGTAVHWDGLRWRLEPTGVAAPIEAVAFGSETIAFALAGPHILRWDGQAWSAVQRATVNLHGLVALGPDELVAVGDGGMIVHLQGDVLGAQMTDAAQTLRAIVRTAAGELVAVGDLGAIVHARAAGGPWERETTDNLYDLHALARAGDDVIAVGARATILRRTPDGRWSDESERTTRGTLRAVAAAGDGLYAMGAHELVLGPLLGIPEELSPPPGGLLQDRITWTARPGLEAHFSMIEFGSEIGPCSACGFMFMIPYSEWRTVLRGDQFEARFPEFWGMPNTASLSSGVKSMTLYRVRTDETFDYDHTATTGFYGGMWRAWAWRSEAFLK